VPSGDSGDGVDSEACLWRTATREITTRTRIASVATAPTSAIVRRDRFNSGGPFTPLDAEGEEFFHELVDLSPIIGVRGLQTVVVHDEHRLSAPVSPAISTNLLVDRLTQLAVNRRFGKAWPFESTPNATDQFGFRHAISRDRRASGGSSDTSVPRAYYHVLSDFAYVACLSV
jgi:hypothetical protein